MNNYLVKFRELAWESPRPGVRHKFQNVGDRCLRLAEFTEEFIELDWCSREHIGYVIEGQVMVRFEKQNVLLRKGDVLHIPAGHDHRHKAIVAKGEKAVLLFFEDVR